jgi:hypothetical protein
VSQLGEIALTVTRQQPGAYNPVTGVWEDGAGPPDVFTIIASVQPVTPWLVEMLPEGARDAARFSLYAEADQPELYDIDISDGRRPDRIEYRGRNFWLQSTGDWTADDSGIPHYEYVMLSVGEDEPDG